MFLDRQRRRIPASLRTRPLNNRQSSRQRGDILLKRLDSIGPCGVNEIRYEACYCRACLDEGDG